jgi:hypothetical protein
MIAALRLTLYAEDFTYPDSWGRAGITLERNSVEATDINFSITQFSLKDILIEGAIEQEILLPGVFLPNEEGMPNLPGVSRFIAIPQGATADFSIESFRTDSFTGIDVAPAPHLPFDIEDNPPQYQKNRSAYGINSFFPASPVQISEPMRLRGVDVVLLGITPFQYNPVTKELLVYRDLKVKVACSGGNDAYGESRLRSRWWDPILADMLLNSDALPSMNYSYAVESTRDANVQDVEYLIITPDDPGFIAWGDSLRIFRNQQGIKTGLITTAEIGGNTFEAIESYINNAYNTWNPAPSAVLLMGDYGTSGSTIVSSPKYPHPYSGTYISDNYYADVDGDDLPDIALSRMTAQNVSQLEIMVNKILDYERHPPTDPGFYDHPVTAMGWQTERWFQLCSEIINGFWDIKLGKNPVRENAIYSGTPGTVWSTATNTETIVDYFGPNGLGYIPENTGHLTDWGGNATRINADINSGAFMVQHRDHGDEEGWGEPYYTVSSLSGLNNDELPFVFSVNCLTGQFDWSGECFTEAFHRHAKRALGLIAATQVSYSFVNDTYTWGMYDNMWPDFMPAEQTWFPQRYVLPAFANSAGKYFLQQSDWPYNTDDKEITYYLFHHHGCSYSTVYTEVPENLTVTHNTVLDGSASTFTITADAGSLIGLSVRGELIGVAEGTGDAVDVAITPQTPGDTMLVTVTKQNYYRYTSEVMVVSSSGPYIAVDTYAVNDALTGNANGLADFGESAHLNVAAKNFGSSMGYHISGTLSSSDSWLTITDNYHTYGDIDSGITVPGDTAFAFRFAENVADQHSAACKVTFKDQDNLQWISNIKITANAPVFDAGELSIDDSSNPNPNQQLDPGETAALSIEAINIGHADAPNVTAQLRALNSGVTVLDAADELATLSVNETDLADFQVYADASLPQGSSAIFEMTILSGAYSSRDTFEVIVGNVPEYVMASGTVTVANAIFYDTGGSTGNYSDRERITMTFTPQSGLSGLTLKFTAFNVADGDELAIYDGATTSATPLPGSPFSGTTLPAQFTTTNADGALTFDFSSNFRGNESGWRAEISPEVALAMPDFPQAMILSHKLFASYPNPFNAQTAISYQIASPGEVELMVYNVLGQEVAKLVKGVQQAGRYAVNWDASGVTSGVYFCRISVTDPSSKNGKFEDIRKMLLIK